MAISSKLTSGQRGRSPALKRNFRLARHPTATRKPGRRFGPWFDECIGDWQQE